MVTSTVDLVDYKNAKNYTKISDFIIKPIYPEELAIINSIEDN